MIVFDTFDDRDRSRVWIASADRSLAPRELTADGDVEERPSFGASGDIYFMRRDSANQRFLFRMKLDGTGRQKLSDEIAFLVSMSPDDRFAVVWTIGDTRLMGIGVQQSSVVCSTCAIGPILHDSPALSLFRGGAWTRYRRLPRRLLRS